MKNVKYLAFAAKRNFGIELEVSAAVTKEKLRDAIASVDDHVIKVHGHYLQDYNNKHWSIKFDRSCKDKQHAFGYEIASYVCSGIKDIQILRKVVKAVKKAGAAVNDNCSIHVHVNVADFSTKHMATLLAWWMKIEGVVAQIVPMRRRKSKYCCLLRTKNHPWLNSRKSYDWEDFWSKVAPNKHRAGEIHVDGWPHGERRLAVNTTSYVDSFSPFVEKKRPTVEFRLPESSIDPDTVVSWIYLFVRFVQLCKKRPFPTNLQACDLDETLKILGLNGTTSEPVLLSRGLWKTKTWFLRRIFEQSSKQVLTKGAARMLDEMGVEVPEQKSLKTIVRKLGKVIDFIDVVPA